MLPYYCKLWKGCDTTYTQYVVARSMLLHAIDWPCCNNPLGLRFPISSLWWRQHETQHMSWGMAVLCVCDENCAEVQRGVDVIIAFKCLNKSRRLFSRVMHLLAPQIQTKVFCLGWRDWMVFKNFQGRQEQEQVVVLKSNASKVSFVEPIQKKHTAGLVHYITTSLLRKWVGHA